MKRLILVVTLLAAGILQSAGQYPLRTIRQIQEVSADSLRKLDTLQRTQLNRWTLQTSPDYILHDTVRVRGVCVVPAKVINFTAVGYNLVIADTADRSQWGGLFVRPNLSAGSPDTSLAIQWGILNVQPGDYIEVTGYIDEFPATDPASYTQIVPLYSQPLTIFPNPVPIPPFVSKQVSDFWVGAYPSSGPYPPNGIQFSTGEPMELMRVTLTHLTVAAVVNGTNGTFQMVDQSGNFMSTMDASKWFTLRGHRDPLSTYAMPAIGAVIDTIRGYILTNSGQEAARGYRIAPILPGDIKYGAVALPIVNTHRRNPIVVPPDSTPRISCKITRGGVGINTAQLRYSLNNGPFVNVAMAFNASDTTYRAQIPVQVANTFVRYYINVADSLGNVVKLASSATDGSQTDTLRGFFFYNVLNQPITIKDIQTTPYPNGRTPYLGASVTVRGVVTADTASMLSPPPRFRGTTAWYMQNGNQPWSGIWVYNDSLSPGLLSIHNGDSISVTGIVAEDFDVTRIERLSGPPTVISQGNPLPAPVVLTTGTFGAGVGNGATNAERWEGMLVQFNNVVMPDSEPTFQEIYEYAVDDGSGAVLVRRDGKNSYTTTVNDSVGKILIRKNAHISYIRGIVYFAGGGGGFRYKLVPRTNADFGLITGVDIEHTPTIPDRFSLTQNYPNPFNPSTAIRYSLPGSEFVTLRIYNVLGQEVDQLVNQMQTAGEYTVHYDASRLTSGVYFYQLSAGSFSNVRKMLLLK